VHFLIFILLLLALLVTGVLGTETRLLFFWPGCALLALAGLLTGLRWKIRVRFPPSDYCLASVAALTLYLTGRAWFSPVVSLAREDLYLVLGCFTAYVLMVTVVNHPHWRIAVLGVLLTLAAGNLAVGLVHFSGNWSFHVVPHFVRTFGEGRIGGFFNNPNHLAAFFSHVIFLCAGIVCFGRGSATWKLLLSFFIVTLAIGISLTVSRGALLGLIVGGFVFAILGLWMVWQTQRHLFTRILVGGITLTILGGGLLYKINEEHLRRRMNALDATADVRTHVWRTALNQHDASTHPWIGDGARSFYDLCFQYRPKEMPVWSADPLFTHNDYLQMLVDYGWIGLVLLALVVLTHVINGLSFLHWFGQWKYPMVGLMPSNGVGLTLGSLAGLTATMVHGIFEFHWHVAATALTGSLLLGILANPGFQGPEHQPRRLPGVRLFLKLGLICASVVMLFGVATVGRADYQSAKAAIAAKDKDSFGQIRALSEVIDLDPQAADAFYQRGLLWLDQVNEEKSVGVNRRALEKARADFERAIGLNPDRFLYPLALADTLDSLGKKSDARKNIDLAIELAPQHEEPRLSLAIHLNRHREWAAAEKAYLWASEASASNLNGSMRWGDAYFEMLRQAAAEAVPEAAQPLGQP
jgi:O-antigen ligase